MLEHKSNPEKYPHLQLLRYKLEIWESQIKQKEKIKPVLPIIFYHGRKKWRKRPFESYFTPLDENLRKYIPAFEYHLTDLNDYSDEDIRKLKASFLINTLLILKHAWDQEYLRNEAVSSFSKIELREGEPDGRNFIQAMFVYYFRITEFSVNQTIEIMEQLSKPVKKVAKSTYDRFVEKGLKEGLEEGLEKGDRRRSRIVVHNLRQKGVSIEDIAEAIEISIDEVQKLLEEKKYSEE